SFTSRTAIKCDKTNFSYSDLLDTSKSIALVLLDGKKDLEEQRIAFIVPPGFDYVSIQWGIWRAGGIAVPLCVKHPLPSIRHVIEDSQSSVVVYSREYEKLIKPLQSNQKIRFIHSDGFKP